MTPYSDPVAVADKLTRLQQKLKTRCVDTESRISRFSEPLPNKGGVAVGIVEFNTYSTFFSREGLIKDTLALIERTQYLSKLKPFTRSNEQNALSVCLDKILTKGNLGDIPLVLFVETLDALCGFVHLGEYYRW